MRQLSIDIETYSSNDIKLGVYKYVDAPDFQILLFAYAFNDEPVELIDLACGDVIPSVVLSALTDKSILKKAYNAQFERVCIGKYLGIYLDSDQWWCTMAHAAQLGLPGRLGDVAAVLKLSEQKDKAGTLLINYFSKPCKPSKSNGGRLRNYPYHDMDRWDLFGKYCKQDVETERAIGKYLETFPVHPNELLVYREDQRINDLGILVDLQMVKVILNFYEGHSSELLDQSTELTGLDNVNSRAQLLTWIQDQGVDVKDIKKETLDNLLEGNIPEEVRMVIENRLETGKASVKKYQMLVDATTADNRIHGTLQYYGANRTGRWCLTGDHEILTSEGWLTLESWQGGKIACWNSTGDILSFQDSKKLEFCYEGELIHLQGARIDQISTPDHKMACLTKGGHWNARIVNDLKNVQFRFPITGKRLTTSSFNNDELRILIMTQADGHCTDDAVRYHFKKVRKIERCRTLLRRAGISFVEASNKDGSTVITIKNRFMPVWLRMFRDKRFGPWLLNESADVVFDEIENWDAYRCGPNSVQYSTIVKENADMIQALAHLSGRVATVLTKNRGKDNWNTAYIVNIWLTPGRAGTFYGDSDSFQFNGTVYCAETKTGYFLVRRNGRVWVTGNSGRLVQVQNLTKNYLPEIDAVRELVKKEDFETLEMLYPSMADLFSQLIRTSFIAKEGYTYAIADYSAIEARVIAWLAGEEWVSEVFRNDGDIYKQTAAKMFGIPVDKIDKGLRQKGKVSTLALGYQGGAGALIAMGAIKMGIPEEDLPELVSAWRKANPHIVKLWKDVEKRAVHAVKNKTTVELHHGISFICEKGYLFIQLPSGRRLSYFHPIIKGDGFAKIEYAGIESGKKIWGKNVTYGGKLTENIVQAIARDCLAEALLKIAAAGYETCFHIHDEVVVEIPKENTDQDLAVIRQLMGSELNWAPGLYLTAAGYSSDYYLKD